MLIGMLDSHLMLKNKMYEAYINNNCFAGQFNSMVPV